MSQSINTSIPVFNHPEFGNLEIIFIDDRPYFPATDCARILGYAEPEKAVRTHCKGVSKMDTPSNGGTQQKNFIPEGDLYRLIIRSKLPAAEKFELWVFDDLLPTLRKSKSYSLNQSQQVIPRDNDAQVGIISEMIQQGCTEFSLVITTSDRVSKDVALVQRQYLAKISITEQRTAWPLGTTFALKKR